MDEAGVSSQEITQKIKESGGLKTAMLDGNLDEGIVTVSSAIGLIKEIKACKEIVAELMEDFKRNIEKEHKRYCRM